MHEGRLECRFLEATISEVQSALLRRGVMRAGFWAAAAAMVATAALLTIDGITGFAAGMRPVVYGLAMAAGAAVVGAAMFAGRAQVLPPICVAGLIEQARPDLKNALVTFVELREDPAANPSMAAAVGRRAAMILAESEVDDFVAMGCVRRAAWAAMGGACLLGATLWLVGGVLFNFGPVAAQAGLMGVGTTQKENGGAAIRREPGSAAATFGQTPGAEKSAAGPGAAAETRGQSLAAAMRADKEIFSKLAAALGEKQGGTSAAGGGQGADAGGAGGGADENGAGGRAPSEGGAGGGADGRAPSASDSGRAPSVGSGSRTNGEKRPSAGENSAAGENAANAASAADTTGGAPNAGVGDNLGDKAGGSPGDNPGGKPGGNAGPGGAAGTGDVPNAPKGQATAPPLTKRPQSDAFPEKTLGAMRTVRRLIDEADKRLREGEVSDAFLGRMGMSNAEFRRFVAGWQRQIETAPREAERGASANFRIPFVGPVGGPGAGGAAPKLEFSPGGGGTNARPIRGLAPQAAAIRGGAVQGTDTSVSVRLRPAVSAYFEKVGSLAAEKAGPKAEE